MKQGWEIKKLGEVCEFYRGLTYSKNDEVDFSDNIVLRSNNIDLYKNELDLTELKYINSSLLVPENKKVKKGALIICTANGSKSHLGKVALIDRDYNYAFGGFMGLVIPKQTLESKFIFYLMTSDNYKNFINELSDGANINNLKFTDLGNYEIPLPPLSEQKRIVAILDESFAAIDKAKANAEQNLKNAKELFESYLQRVFENKGEDWEEKRLGEVCSLITDGKHGDCENQENSGYYFLSAKDVRNGTLLFEGARQITKSGFEETHKRTNLKPGDICMVNTGATIGRISFAPDDPRTYKTTFQKSVAIIKTISTLIDNNFCCYILQSDLKKLVKISSGTAVPNLLLGDLKRLKINLPKSITEQQTIVRQLDALRAETQKLEAIYEKKLEDLEELKKSILQKAFKGELVSEPLIEVD
ncbi:MAG: restriction endonuclease subunit S [Cytophagaceae bacterium]